MQAQSYNEELCFTSRNWELLVNDASRTSNEMSPVMLCRDSLWKLQGGAGACREMSSCYIYKSWY